MNSKRDSLTRVNEPPGRFGFQQEVIQLARILSISPLRIPFFCLIVSVTPSMIQNGCQELAGALGFLVPRQQEPRMPFAIAIPGRWGRFFSSSKQMCSFIDSKGIRCTEPIRAASWSVLSQSEPMLGVGVGLCV